MFKKEFEPKRPSIKVGKAGRPTLDLSRRRFLKSLAFTGVAITATGAVAKKVSSVVTAVPYGAAEREYMKDIMRLDRSWKGQGLVMMSEGEKRDLVRFFKKSYREQA